MTETMATVTSHSSEDYLNRPTSAGPAVAVADLEIRDDDGVTVLPTGTVGELWARGPMIVKGYWNKPEATAETFVDGWVRTGDLARLDDEGFVYIVDRAKDMVLRGGENIYSSEVENALYEHPAVTDCAIIGIPHRTLGEEPAAVVHLAPGMTASERIAGLGARAARRVQGAGGGAFRRRHAAAQCQWQDIEEGSEGAVRRPRKLTDVLGRVGSAALPPPRRLPGKG